MEASDRRQCLDMMQQTFLDDEPLCQVLEIKKDPASIQTIRDNWEAMADQGICIACYSEENGQPKDLVGFNILVVKSIDDDDEDFDSIKGEQWKKLLLTLTATEELVNLFQHFAVSEYLTSSGLAVVSEHRGQNIGAKLIASREQICKAFGLQAVATVFTAIPSQVLAAKCGYQVLAELPYAEMRKHGVDLTKCSTPSAKLMGIRYS
ncbi:uncharacterized protein LOC119838054 [Zerene cesonia]|uniref:uncharacterized protein LOC119838054 n=1 Tax=Zerene cesonia TaxID=33412 RepID=UPI0018E5A73E|nr:uncharacterized protein LOC119838054 [Zerene cesonia]